MQKKQFATRIDPLLLKPLKILAAKQEKPINNLMEEAIKGLLKKYGEKVESKK